MRPVAGGVVGGRYRLEKQLGEGGMASVWMAYDIERRAAVALKFMSPEYASSDQARMRFEREALAPMQLKSPYIVEIYGYGLEGDTPFIIMEMLEGEDLLKRIRREGRMTPGAAGKLLTQIADGLHQAHKAGIIHRDLKPANIFMTRVGNEEVPKIVDFGIAKAKHGGSGDEATRTGTILGSFNYISPEQLRSSKDVDHRSDLWSLGVILLRLITGKIPFPGDDHAELVMKICAGPIPTPSELAPELNLPSEFDGFFRRALERDKTRRFQTAQEMAEQWNRLLIGLPEDPHNSTEPLGEDEAPSRERSSTAEELEYAARRISSAMRRVPAHTPEAQGSAVEITDGQMLQVIYHGSERPPPEAPSSAPRDAEQRDGPTVAMPVEDGAGEDLVSTQLKIDVDLASSPVESGSDQHREIEVAQTSRQGSAMDGRGRRRSVLLLIFAAVMVAAVAIAVLGARTHSLRQSDPGLPASTGGSPR